MAATSLLGQITESLRYGFSSVLVRFVDMSCAPLAATQSIGADMHTVARYSKQVLRG